MRPNMADLAGVNRNKLDDLVNERQRPIENDPNKKKEKPGRRPTG